MEIVEKEDFARDQINQLQSAISDLDERSQLILKERWLTDDKPLFMSWLTSMESALNEFAKLKRKPWKRSELI